jgi:hypothetical protein
MYSPEPLYPVSQTDNGAMDAEVNRVIVTFAELGENELHAVIAATNGISRSAGSALATSNAPPQCQSYPGVDSA